MKNKSNVISTKYAYYGKTTQVTLSL